MAYQGHIDECGDYNVFVVDLDVPAKVVRNTFKHSTQHGVLPPSSHLQKQFKSPNPIMNLHQRNEADATDQIFSDTPAMDGGETSAHIFVGQDSRIVDVTDRLDISAMKVVAAFIIVSMIFSKFKLLTD